MLTRCKNVKGDMSPTENTTGQFRAETTNSVRAVADIAVSNN